MRTALAVIVCLFLCEFALHAQSTQASDNSAQSTQQASGTNNRPSAQQNTDDDNRPVLKRRPKNDSEAPVAIDEGQPQSGQQKQANQLPPNRQEPGQTSGPVLQQRVPAPSTIPSARSVPVNTQFRVALDETLSSRNSHNGDTFTATLEEPLRSTHGDVLIPSGTKVLGTVQDAESGKVFASMRGKGKLILRFNQIVLPGGERLPIQATLLSVGENKAKAAANQEGEITSGAKASDAVKKVGIGAGVGTLAGVIFGGALKGAAIGAIAGGGYAMATAAKDVEVPAHTSVRLRLDQYLTLGTERMGSGR